MDWQRARSIKKNKVRYEKNVLIIAAICVVVFFVLVIKTISTLTPGDTIVKKYSWSGDVKEFISHVRKFSVSDSSVIFKMTDTNGTAKTGYGSYMEIELKKDKRDLVYSILCENATKGASSETSIELIMGFDKINKIGGYNDKAKGIQPLVDYFEANFLKPLTISQNIKIITLK